jgi:hypothetical protein
MLFADELRRVGANFGIWRSEIVHRRGQGGRKTGEQAHAPRAPFHFVMLAFLGSGSD